MPLGELLGFQGPPGNVLRNCLWTVIFLTVYLGGVVLSPSWLGRRMMGEYVKYTNTTINNNNIFSMKIRLAPSSLGEKWLSRGPNDGTTAPLDEVITTTVLLVLVCSILAIYSRDATPKPGAKFMYACKFTYVISIVWVLSVGEHLTGFGGPLVAWILLSSTKLAQSIFPPLFWRVVTQLNLATSAADSTLKLPEIGNLFLGWGSCATAVFLWQAAIVKGVKCYLGKKDTEFVTFMNQQDDPNENVNSSLYLVRCGGAVVKVSELAHIIHVQIKLFAFRSPHPPPPTTHHHPPPRLPSCYS